MTLQDFETIITRITGAIHELPVDDSLGAVLTDKFPPGGETFEAIAALCAKGIKEGWMCGREMGGVKFGRVIKATTASHGFSVDVVVMRDIKGPHHRHPKGEIDMVMPVSPGAQFDGRGRGWCVYGPDSAHHPTVTGGEAVVLYLLPDGAIEFT